MPWLELHLQNLSEQITEIGDYLTEQGALAVTLQDSADQPLYEPELNTTPLWQHTNIIGLFEQDADIQKIVLSIQIMFNLPTSVTYQVIQVEDKDWLSQCKDLFKTVYINNKLRICPSWDVPAEANNIATVLLDPGVAFGTGSHATTKLCLKWLATHLSQPKTVIDYGCGSGILGIAANKLGAQQVYAVDIDQQALDATRENAYRNQINLQHLATYLPRELPRIQADLLIANILVQPLLHLLPEFLRLLKENGEIVLSGILEEQVTIITEAYHDHFLFEPYESLDGWSCLWGKRHEKASI